MKTFQIFSQILKQQSLNTVNGITFITNQGDAFVSYKKIYANAYELTGILREKGIKRKDEIILQIDEPIEFIIGFWACIIGGFIPVPVSVGNNLEHRLKLIRIWQTLNNPYLLSSSEAYKRIIKFVSENGYNEVKNDFEGKSIIFVYSNYEWVEEKYADIDLEQNIQPSDIAFIQFSSGSTGIPKGVIVTHEGLIINIESIIDGNETTDRDSYLSWMPLTHDMGLIGLHLTPLFKGINQFIMPTNLFIRRPTLWLEKCSEYKVTFTASPNFGYKHFLRAFENKETCGLDLSSLRLISNGAEPISLKLCNEFLDKMSPFGLKKSCMFPVYGLAEATLAVTFPPVYESVRSLTVDRCHLLEGEHIVLCRDGVDFVDLGYPLKCNELRITDAMNNGLADEHIGYVQIKGKNVTAGYYNNKEATESLILPDGWLNTGDMGFVKDGRLYLTGRAKDIIFINGQNYYSYDIERIVEDIPGAETGKVVATGIFDHAVGEENLVLFVMFKKKNSKEFKQLSLKLCERISGSIGIKIDKVVSIKSIPKTTSGKVQRFMLKEQYINGMLDSYTFSLSEEEKDKCMDKCKARPDDKAYKNKGLNTKTIEETAYVIKSEIARLLKRPCESIDCNVPFSEYGMDSLCGEQLAEALEQKLDRLFSPCLIWDYPTVELLSRHLSGEELNNKPEAADLCSDEPIAVIGMACRFPGGANSTEKFWTQLANGIDSISIMSDNRKSLISENPNIFSFRGGFVDNIDKFDPQFFSISPKEAVRMDPQQRILLEVVWEALESGGIPIRKIEGTSAGVFIGISSNDYSKLLLENEDDLNVFTGTGNSHSIAANRISYILNLKGPSISVDTACSSSLVAVHYACESIRRGQSEIAIAGGVNIILLNEISQAFSNANMLSPDGKCKTFDSSANGYVRGEGCGVVILKRFSSALKDKDNIIAVIKGSAVNQDGKSNGLTAPSGPSQKRVITMALNMAGMEPKDISYIETHGTGTALGDPIELNTLYELFGSNRRIDNQCFLGAVKTNIGHLEAAAGIASLIKTALCLQKKEIPPNLNFHKINPYINIDESVFVIPTRLETWHSKSLACCAGISSFGFGGSNSHIILQEYICNNKICNGDGKNHRNILFISGKRKMDLSPLIRSYIEFLKSNEKYSLEDICYTSNVGRNHFQYRAAFIADSLEHMEQRLETYLNELKENEEVPFSFFNKNEKALIFTFSGQPVNNMQTVNYFYTNYYIFKDSVNQCRDILKKYTDIDIIEVINGNHDLSCQYVGKQICSFVFEYSLAQLWISIGIQPTLTMGYGVGEFVASCIDGMFTLEDMLKLSVIRSGIISSLITAKSTVIVLSAAESIINKVKGFPALDVEYVVDADITIIRGNNTDINAIIQYVEMTEQTYYQLPLHEKIDYDSVRRAIDEDFLKGIKINRTKTRFETNILGQNMLNDQNDIIKWVVDSFKVTHLNSIAGRIGLQEGGLFLNIGYSKNVSEFLKNRILPEKHKIVSSVSNKEYELTDILYSIKQIYDYGFDFNWEALSEVLSIGNKVPLPSYTFQRSSYWFKFKTKLVDDEERNTIMNDSYKKDVILLLREQSALIKQHAEMISNVIINDNSIIPAINKFNLESEKSNEVSDAESKVLNKNASDAAADLNITSGNHSLAEAISMPNKKTISVEFISESVIRIISDITAYPTGSIELENNIIDDLGFDSIMLSDLASKIKKAFPLGEKNYTSLAGEIYRKEPTVKEIISLIIDKIKDDYIIEGGNCGTSSSNKEYSDGAVKNAASGQFRMFEEYLELKSRIENIEDFNPYFKVNTSIARDTIKINDVEMINYSTYNYLGLNGEEEVIDSAVQAIKCYGTSASGSRLLSGEIAIHKELEDEIAGFLGTEDSIVFIGGHSTNVTTVAHLVGEGDLIIHDSLSHNSIIQGCLMSGAARRPFPHNDWEALNEILTLVRPSYRRVLIVIEGVYSMDGDIAKLPEFIKVKKKHNALLMVDEAHSLGTIGMSGKGIGEYFNVDRGDVDIWMGTLSKSLASCGGYIAGSRELVMYLKYTAPGFIFSVGISPVNTAAAIAAIRCLKSKPQLVERLKYNGQYFLKLVKDKGLNTGLSADSPIIPVIIGDSEICLRLSNALLLRNVNVMPIVYPAVDEKSARLRFFVSALHTEEQMHNTVEILAEEINKLNEYRSILV